MGGAQPGPWAWTEPTRPSAQEMADMYAANVQIAGRDAARVLRETADEVDARTNRAVCPDTGIVSHAAADLAQAINDGFSRVMWTQQRMSHHGALAYMWQDRARRERKGA